VSAPWDETLAVDLADLVAALALPAYFFHGVYDYTVSYRLAKDYADRLKAPVKGFYTFERSAHSPILEEPQKARRIMHQDLLVGANSLADGARRLTGHRRAAGCAAAGYLLGCGTVTVQLTFGFTPM
jgi:hypothetical protein